MKGHIKPKEFAARLKAAGLPVCSETVRNYLRAGLVDYKNTSAGKRPRYWIPESEVDRFIKDRTSSRGENQPAA